MIDYLMISLFLFVYASHEYLELACNENFAFGFFLSYSQYYYPKV